MQKESQQKGAYAINKQTLRVNSRKIILRPVVYQNRFETFCFYSYITYKMVLKEWLTNEVTAWYNSLFMCVSNAWKDVLLIDHDISPWILASQDCFLSVGNHFSLGSLQGRLLSSSHARTLRMFYYI